MHSLYRNQNLISTVLHTIPFGAVFQTLRVHRPSSFSLQAYISCRIVTIFSMCVRILSITSTNVHICPQFSSFRKNRYSNIFRIVSPSFVKCAFPSFHLFCCGFPPLPLYHFLFRVGTDHPSGSKKRWKFASQSICPPARLASFLLVIFTELQHQLYLWSRDGTAPFALLTVTLLLITFPPLHLY